MKSRTPAIAARRRCWALWSLTVLVAGCATTTAGTATPAAPPPEVTAQNLATLLLAAADVGAAMSASGMVITRQVTAPWDDSAGIAAGPGCLAVAGAAQRGVYTDADWTALHGQVLREPPTAPTWAHFATQAVVLFDSATAAADFFARSRQTWAGCSDRDLTYAPQLAPAEQIWSIGPVSVHRFRKDSDVLTVSRQQRSPQQWSCQRALTVQGRVAVDVEACTLEGPTSAAATIARAIAERIGPA
jgi:hypothetical protein